VRFSAATRRPGRPRKAVPIITMPSSQSTTTEITMTLPPPLSTQVGQHPVSDDPNKEIPPFTDEEDQIIKNSIEKWGTNWDLITDLVNHYKVRSNVGPGPAVIRLKRHVFERWRDTILPTTTPNNNNVNNNNSQMKRYVPEDINYKKKKKKLMLPTDKYWVRNMWA